jgi:hypothetical protein
MGTFHTNKGGEYMGSTEMENVSRVLLKAVRANPQDPLTVFVRKSNFKHPDFGLQFAFKESQVVDTETGEVQLEENQEGVLVPSKLSYVERIDNRKLNSAPIESFQDHPRDKAKQEILKVLKDAGGEIKSADLRDYVLEDGEISLRTYRYAVAELVSEGFIESSGEKPNATYELIIGDGANGI